MAFTKEELLEQLKKQFAHLNDNNAKALEVYKTQHPDQELIIEKGKKLSFDELDVDENSLRYIHVNLESFTLRASDRIRDSLNVI